MCKVIDFTSKLIKEDEIRWSIRITPNSDEQMSIMRNPANDGIMIYLTTNFFDRIEVLRQKALKELKQQLLKDEVEYV